MLRIAIDENPPRWKPPKIITGPIYAASDDEDFYISRSLIESVIQTNEAVLATRSGIEVAINPATAACECVNAGPPRRRNSFQNFRPRSRRGFEFLRCRGCSSWAPRGVERAILPAAG